MNLKIDYCSFDACKYAVKHWHYSKCLPAGKLLKYGVWEDERFIGCVIFSRGANNHLLNPYNLKMAEGCELTRIALNKHKEPLSKILKIAIVLLKKQNPGLKLIVSFADSSQNHLGIIYQATNWIYSGIALTTKDYFVNGKWRHSRYMSSMNLDRSKYKTRPAVDRYRYLYPLTKEMRNQILKLSKPYPKKICGSSVNGSTSSFQDEGNVQINSAAL